MPIVKAKPTSPGRRFVIRVATPGLHKGKPWGPLTKKKKRTGGRNNKGRITVRHRERRAQADLAQRRLPPRQGRDPRAGGAPGVRPQPFRPPVAGAVRGRRAPLRHRPPWGGDRSEAALGSERAHPGRKLPAASQHSGRTTVHCIELKPGSGAQLARSAGASVQIVAREGSSRACGCGPGDPPGSDRLPGGHRGGGQRGARPAFVRQGGRKTLARDSADRAGGGHEPGRPSPRCGWRGPILGGRHPVTPSGQPTKGHRTRRNKRSDKMIVRRRGRAASPEGHGRNRCHARSGRGRLSTTT